MERARELTVQLRAGGSRMLPSFIAGPIVVLDLDTGALSTLCDQSAVSGTHTWGQMLADPNRSAPSCRPGTTAFTCSQFSKAQMLIIELADPDQWRVVSVIVGNYRNGRATLSANMAQMRSLVATATCP